MVRYKGRIERDGESWIVRYHGREIDVTEDFDRLVMEEARAVADSFTRTCFVPKEPVDDDIISEGEEQIDGDIRG